MTAVDLDALDKLRGAATPGPWEVSVEPDAVWLSAPNEEWPGEIYGERRREDAVLIVAAVNALPDLIAEARKYRALRAAVEDVLNQIPFQGPAGLEHRIRAALDAEP